MKKNLTLNWLLLTVFALFSFQTFAKEFKGVITYKITVEGSGCHGRNEKYDAKNDDHDDHGQ